MSRWVSRAALPILIALVLLSNRPSTGVRAESLAAAGGFVEAAASAMVRAPLTAAQIQAFLPDRGTFTFPSPYNTQGVRLTNALDCGGNDCVHSVGYSYWANINNHVGSDTMLIFLTLQRTKGGGGPTLFSFNKRTGQVSNLGPLFSADSASSFATGEGWYFSATQPTKLYLNDGPRMVRFDVMTKTPQTVYDVTSRFGSDKYVVQMHSSNDDRVHSFTIGQRSNFERLGCVVYREDTSEVSFYPKLGSFDECQIDRSGRWLVIKQNIDGEFEDDNLIVDLQTGAQRILRDQNGAGGHSDMGFGYMVAEDNFAPVPGAVRVWDFALDVTGGTPFATDLRQGRRVYSLMSWSSGIGHLAHGNAAPGIAFERQTACASNASRELLPRVNEIVCFRLDGSENALVVAPNLTDLNASGGGSDDYWKLPKGNVDATGEYFIWTANAASNRLDAFLVRIPQFFAVTPPSSATQVLTIGIGGPGRGTITTIPAAASCGNGCYAFSSATPVTLVAQPMADSSFAGWGGDADCGDGLVTMSAARSCTARFVPLPGGERLDLNGDGLGDAFTYNPLGGGWSLEYGSRGGGFTTSRSTWSAGWIIRGAEFNDDGRADLFLYNPVTGQWVRATSNARGDFDYFSGFWSPGWNTYILDLDRDRRSDVFLYSVATGEWFECLTREGDFVYHRGSWSPQWEVYPAELDGDGFADLFLYNASNGIWVRAQNDRLGSFVYGSGSWDPDWEIYPADFNADGRSDLFLYRRLSGAWVVATNAAPAFTYTGGRWDAAWQIASGDLNGDRRADLFVYRSDVGNWVECVSDGAGGFSYTSGRWDPGWEPRLSDINGDRLADLVLYNRDYGIWLQALNAGLGTFTYVGGNWNTERNVVLSRGSVP